MHFTHGQLTFAYRTFGKGYIPVIAFHGFGRTGQDFAVFEEALGDLATIHAFDLPFHGESPSPVNRVTTPYGPLELRDFFRAFVEHIGAGQITFMGYSLGGRLVLSLLDTMPERVSQAILIAPDGLKTKPWYRALAASAWGRRRYARFVEHPERLQWIIGTLHRLGLMSDKMHRFLLDQTSTREKRELVRDVWLSFREVEPDLSAVGYMVCLQDIQVDMLFGRHDRVIRTQQGQRLARHAPQYVRIHELEAGHTLLTPATGGFLRGLMRFI